MNAIDSPRGTPSAFCPRAPIAPPMTDLLYLDDAYLRSCRASVRRVDGRLVELDRTVLYAEGGGQAPDHGAIRWEGGAARVVDSQYVPGSVEGVVHLVAEGDPLPSAGAEVEVEVDWPRRHGLMRHHTAAHVLSAVVYHGYRGVTFTGGQLYPDRARFDFEFKDWRPELKDELAARVNAEIAKDYPVRNYSIPREEFATRTDLLRTKENLVDPRFEKVRVTDIVGLDAQADGGTHVRSTREVGRFVVDKVDNKGKGHRRLSVHVE